MVAGGVPRRDPADRGGLVFCSERLAARGGDGARASGSRESVAVALYACTGLPIIVAVTASAVAAGQMSQTNASVLVAGGGITVLLCPLAASLLLAREVEEPAGES